MPHLHNAHEQVTPEPRPLIPLPPPEGGERLAWFAELGAVISIDCLSLAAQQLAAGAAPADVEEELKAYRNWLSDRLAGAVDGYLAAVSWHAIEVAA